MEDKTDYLTKEVKIYLVVTLFCSTTLLILEVADLLL